MPTSQEDDEDFASFVNSNTESTEIADDEFPRYFIERDGRLFHSHGSSPYPLPVDAPEQQRFDVQHIVLKMLLGANYVGPVPLALAPSATRRKIVLDLGCGTGKWAMEMGSEFPQAQIIGIDIVPIATRYPLENVRFEVHDVNEQWTFNDHTVDVVHARSLSMGVHDYHEIIQESGRVLHPGGLFISGEWNRRGNVHPSFGVLAEHYIPGICRFFSVLREALDICCGVQTLGREVPELLAESQLFTNIAAQSLIVPVGPWHPDPSMKRIGRVVRASFRRYAGAVRHLLKLRWSDTELDDIYEAFELELRTRAGIVAIYHIVHAKRL